MTSHDVEGFKNERLFTYFMLNGVTDGEKRTKLAFACLLTAVGVPMILAGDEFADQHDLFDAKGNVTQEGGKQVDPVNFSRRLDDWRQRITEYVSRLVRLRTEQSGASRRTRRPSFTWTSRPASVCSSGVAGWRTPTSR